MSNLPVATPVEAVAISPEALEVANAYLQDQDIHKVAELLDISTNTVSNILSKREVKAYIDHVFMNTGYNNRFKIRALMDAVINKKLQELEESEMGSSKDIAELLQLSHKMSMEEMAKQIELEKLRTNNSIKTQTNIQVNNGGTRYDALITAITGTTNNSEVISND